MAHGTTTQQMLDAPQGAVFIWNNSYLSYPLALARKLGRDDLQIETPGWLTDYRYVGQRLKGLVVDHAIQYTDQIAYHIERARTYVNEG